MSALHQIMEMFDAEPYVPETVTVPALTDGFFAPHPRDQAEMWGALQRHREKLRYTPRNCCEHSLWWQQRVSLVPDEGTVAEQVRKAWASYLKIPNTYPLWVNGQWLDIQYQKYCTTMPFLRVDPERIHAPYYALGAIHKGQVLLIGYATNQRLQDGVWEMIGGRKVYGLYADLLSPPQDLR